MLEIGQKLKVFRPGIGTFEIEIYEIEKCYSYNRVKAKGFKGGYYERETNYIWTGPKNEEYYTLDENGKILDSSMKNYEDTISGKNVEVRKD